ncbi:hypothetical protein [Streptomyces viridosporus]|uniref:hypothetical protein n=1 Tax=Streptomyces viridosporus TaxID=67581 RepID=UPI0014737DFC|nr:hypothetical protein [Streptomyces viridosporus]
MADEAEAEGRHRAEPVVVELPRQFQTLGETGCPSGTPVRARPGGSEPDHGSPSGAAAGLTDTARGTVHDLHEALRETVRRRLAGGDGTGRGGGYGVRVLDAYETDPDVWRTRLLQVLAGSGAEGDEEVLAAARAVLRAERRTGPVSPDAPGSGEVPAGDGTPRNHAFD